MGWRAQNAYDRAMKEEFRRWRKSLTWAEYASWEWSRSRHFLAGAAIAGATFWLLSLMT